MGSTIGKLRMAGNLVLGLLVVVFSVLPSRMSAQDYYPVDLNGPTSSSFHNGGVASGPNLAPQGGAFAQAGYEQAAYFDQMAPGGSYPPSVTQAGWQTGGSEFPGARIASRQLSTYQAALTSALPNSLIKGPASGAWTRLEYLLWTVERPGNTILGAPIVGVRDPSKTFNVTGGTAQVSSLTGMEFRDTSGLRGTIGIPLQFGTFEASAFVLEQAGQTRHAPELPRVAPGIFIATSTLFNGVVSNNPNAVRVYDVSFNASYTSDIWGAQANIVFDRNQPGEGFKIKPVIGIRYLSIQEKLTQVGVSSSGGGFETLIDSDTRNHIFGPNFGFDASIEHRWFSLSARPQITVGTNKFRNRVTTRRWVGPADPLRVNEVDATDFGAAAEIAILLKVPIRENIMFHIGWTSLWAFQVQRPNETIIYDTTAFGGTPLLSNFRAKKHYDDMKLHGLTIGGEIIF